MKTTLNNYTIDDFLKLKPIIYEYCCNLTQKKTSTSWFRNFADADDLYQEVYIYVATSWFSKPREAMNEGKFVQIMKNCTYYAWYRTKCTNTNHKLHNNLNYFQDSEKSLFLFENVNLEYPEYFKDIQDHPDYAFYMKGLKFSERLAINYFLKGYTKTEVAKKFNKKYEFIPYIVKKIEANMLKDKFNNTFNKPVEPIKVKPIVVNDKEYVKSKVSCFDKVFTDDKYIRLYSLYLQGLYHKTIAKRVNKSVSQVNVEIYRINQKIKKYAI